MERLIGLIAVVLLVAAGATAVDDATRRSSPTVTVNNETFDAAGGTVVKLNNSNRQAVYYEDSVDVYSYDINGNNNENEDGVVAEGNYTWNTNNGTLAVVNNSYLDNQTNTSITYNYSRPDKTQRGMAAIIGDGLDVAQLLILVLAAGLVLASVRVLGGL